MRRFLQISLLSSTLLLGADLASARAQEMQALDERGQALLTLFEDVVKNQQSQPLANGTTAKFEGNVSVEKVDDYYAVTLPFISLHYPDGDVFEIGLIAINAAAHQDPDQWKMTFALPTPMNYVSKGKETFQVAIGGQRSSGVWNGKLGYFSKLDANFENINIDDKVKGALINIPSVRVVYDLDSDTDGRWSGPLYFTFNDINATSPTEGGEIFRLGALNMNMEIFKYDPAALGAYRSALNDMAVLPGPNTNNAEQETTPSAPNSPLDDDKLGTMIQSLVALLGDGFTSEFQLADFTMTNYAEDAAFKTLRMADANFGIDMTGFLAKSALINMRTGYNGLTLEPFPQDIPALAPANLNLDIVLEKIPFEEIIALGRSTMESSIANPNMSGLGTLSLAMSLPAILSKAGTSLLLENNYVGNDMYHIDLKGKVITDVEATNSATADITAQFRGMDDITQYLTTQMKTNPEAANVGTMQQALMGLTVLKGFAKAGVNDDGAPVHIFNIVMNPQGQILLNGNDMSMLAGMMGAPKISLGGAGQDDDGPEVLSVEPLPVEQSE